jgi:hypothetical protein
MQIGNRNLSGHQVSIQMPSNRRPADKINRSASAARSRQRGYRLAVPAGAPKQLRAAFQASSCWHLKLQGLIIVHRLMILTMTSLALALGGCVSSPKPIPLNNIAFAGTTTASSSKSARIQVFSGSIQGQGVSVYVPIGKIVLPLQRDASREFQFHEQDQRDFAESLSKELVRVGLLKSVSLDDSSISSDINIKITFVSTYHYEGMQRYILDVGMELVSGASTVQHHYKISSDEGETFWERSNTNGSEAKVKAVRLLLGRVIPDIESFVTSLQPSS